MANENPYGMATGGYAGATVTSGASTPSADRTAGLGTLAAPAPVKDVTSASFAADVIQASRKAPVLVDFWAPWCGPCKQLAPVLEKVVAESRGAVTLVKMNIDEHPSIAGQLGIQSIPAVIAFRDGQPVDGFMGAVPESQIRDFVKRVGAAGTRDSREEIAAAIKAAEDARAAGDAEQAADIYSAILDQVPDNVEATAGLADLLYEAGEKDQALALLDALPEDKATHQAVGALRAKMKLAEETAGLGDAAEFDRRLAADPDDHQARFDRAILRNAGSDRAGAADDLLAIVKADRTWNDGAARAKLLQFFEAWGLMDPATLAARRKLSSMLFS